jgi:PAS domain S-box-containing protein
MLPQPVLPLDVSVLLVDDESDVLKFLHFLLTSKMQGATVDRADSGCAALERIAATDYDVVVSDIVMPGMNGLELLERIRSVRPNMPTVLMTGFDKRELIVQALRGGAYDFLSKPVDPDYFLATVSRAIQMRRLSRQVEEQKAALERHAGNLERIVQERTRELLDEITERKRVEAALAESETFLSTVIEAEPECVKLLARDGTVLMMNRAGLAMIEADTSEQVRGRCVYPIVAEEYRPAFQELTESVFRGEPGKLEFEIVGLKGTRRWLDTKAVPLRDLNGAITAFLGVARDITERKRAEDALRSKTEQLAAVADAITVFLESGDFREASALLLHDALRQTESEYGFVGVVLEGPVLRILAHEGVVWHTTINREFYENALRTYQEVGYLEFTNFDNLFGRVITSGKPVLSNDPSTDHRSGGTAHGHPPLRHFLGVPIQKGTEVVGMIGVANRPGGYTGQEQTKIEILSRAASVLYDSYRQREREFVLGKQRRRAEEALRESEGQLRGALEDREWLSQDLHDNIIQTIYAIGLGLEECRQLVKEGSAESAESALGDAIVRLNGVIRDVRSYIAGRIPQLSSGRQLKAALGRLARTMQTTHSLRFSVTVDEVAAEKLTPEEANNLFSIVQEAMSNSLRHSEARTALVSLRLRDGGVRLQVEDDGVGFDANTAVDHGQGLRNIETRARKLRGRLEVVSERGYGVRIVLDIPKEKKHAPD